MVNIMYLRFVYTRNVDGTSSRQGIFQAVGLMIQSPDANPCSKARALELQAWFNENLKQPERFTSSRSKGYYRRQTVGLSWFKDTAKQHISNAFELSSTLKQNGFAIDVLREKRLGYIVYEDCFQVVAEPFSDTKT